ncbi:hypothetical protein [Escherichia coli]|uniref:hypothetical protein n=1 Tax=Escherichia coli TaxID=562 RepID=UPI00398B6C28
MDISHFIHVLISLSLQFLFLSLFNDPITGAVIGCVFFISREHTQAEYRWIEMFGHGKRMNMPWWGGFDPRVWDVGSLLDFSFPIIGCLLVWILAS